MDESIDINLLLAEIKKLRAEKANAVANTTKKEGDNIDVEASEIDETETWVEEPWNVNNLIDSNELDAIENSASEATKKEIKSNDLDILGNEAAEIKPTSDETNGSADETWWNVSNLDESIPTEDAIDAIENSAIIEPEVEIKDLDIPATEPADIEQKSTTTETDGDETLGCNIYNIPDGTTFMDLTRIFVTSNLISNVVKMDMPEKDSKIGHVTFADRSTLLSILGRTDLIINGCTLSFEPDHPVNSDHIAMESSDKSESQCILQSEDAKEAEIGVEAVEASVSSHLNAAELKRDDSIELITAVLEPKASVVPTILSVAKQPSINESEAPYYPPYICYAYNIPSQQQSTDKLANVFESFSVQKILPPAAGQNCFAIELKTRNDLVRVCKKDDVTLRSSGIEISLSATVSPKQCEASANNSLNEAQIPHSAPFTCYIYDIPPNSSEEDLYELLGGLVVLSLSLNRVRTHARVQFYERKDILELNKRNLILKGSKLRLSLTEINGPPAQNVQQTSIVRQNGTPMSNLNVPPPHQNFPHPVPPHFHHGPPPPPYVHSVPPQHFQAGLPRRPQIRSAPPQQKNNVQSKSGGYQPKPLTSDHKVPKALSDDQIPKVPPFVCKFEELPSNTTNKDISNLLDRLKITKIDFPENAENSATIRYVEFKERIDLISVLNAPVLFLKGTVVMVKLIIVNWPPKTEVRAEPVQSNANTSEPPNRAVYLYGLPKDVNIAELNAPFSAFKIRALNLPSDSIPYGYVEFEHADHLRLAMQNKNLIVRNQIVVMSMIKLNDFPSVTPVRQ